eukprot:gnl/TRDRNA2_/TRDRNA2_92822_c0_seq1.p2 gnl/TRDRNA2_/TRDRNA2_92822_c0~~gnl/TRDRNA2_/TRDRNA2_92822_c0_seq1.p2  ORF type:complete len:136 (+),score=11.57 gnl/TRDRNA2_/TRDRNA2_92822_c0_seq1:112-519(+)
MRAALAPSFSKRVLLIRKLQEFTSFCNILMLVIAWRCLAFCRPRFTVRAFPFLAEPNSTSSCAHGCLGGEYSETSEEERFTDLDGALDGFFAIVQARQQEVVDEEATAWAIRASWSHRGYDECSDSELDSVSLMQ